MEYTINKLAKLAGITTRTLRHYDSLGLLCPKRISSNGYRIYGTGEVDRLQQILFYREMGFSLEKIGELLSAPDFDQTAALEGHLEGLLERQRTIELLIKNVEQTLKTVKGEIKMSDKEKFNGFTKAVVEKNEAEFGAEIREKYGDEAIDRSNERVLKMSRAEYEDTMKLSLKINGLLKEAVLAENPASKIAQEVCALHKEWLCRYYDGYSSQYHTALAQMYVDDPRFRAYYEKITPGAAEFLKEAIMIFCKT